MLTGSVTVSPHLSRALINTVRTPSASTVWGTINVQADLELFKIWKVLRMGLPVEKHLSRPRGSILNPFKSPEINYHFLNQIPRFSLFPLVWNLVLGLSTVEKFPLFPA